MTWQNQQNECAPSKDSDHLGIRQVWSESSLHAHWVAKDPRFLHADSEDWSDFAGRTHRHIVGFVMSQLILVTYSSNITYIMNVTETYKKISNQSNTYLPNITNQSVKIIKSLTFFFKSNPMKSSILIYWLSVMWKPVYVICEQQRRSSACTSAQSDQCLCCSLSRLYDTYSS